MIFGLKKKKKKQRKKNEISFGYVAKKKEKV